MEKSNNVLRRWRDKAHIHSLTHTETQHRLSRSSIYLKNQNFIILIVRT